MKKSVFTLFLIVFSILLLSSLPLHAQTIFKIGISDSPPYEYLLDDGTVTGLSTEIITEIFKEMNLNHYTIDPYQV